MKKKLLALLLLCAGVAQADVMRINRSSFTASNEAVCLATTSTNGQYLVGINVGVASSGGSIAIYDSTWTLTSVAVASVTLASVNSQYYGENGIQLKGICYRTTGNSNGVTIIYKR